VEEAQAVEEEEPATTATSCSVVWWLLRAPHAEPEAPRPKPYRAAAIYYSRGLRATRRAQRPRAGGPAARGAPPTEPAPGEADVERAGGLRATRRAQRPRAGGPAAREAPPTEPARRGRGAGRLRATHRAQRPRAGGPAAREAPPTEPARREAAEGRIEPRPPRRALLLGAHACLVRADAKSGRSAGAAWPMLAVARTARAHVPGPDVDGRARPAEKGARARVSLAKPGASVGRQYGQRGVLLPSPPCERRRGGRSEGTDQVA
jgi:hypothetical protein